MRAFEYNSIQPIIVLYSAAADSTEEKDQSGYFFPSSSSSETSSAPGLRKAAVSFHSMRQNGQRLLLLIDIKLTQEHGGGV